MSQEQLTHISKVQISKLWGKYDIDWTLHKDVNILSGVNGSGKSTVLRIVADALLNDSVELSNLQYEICYITFSDGSVKIVVDATKLNKVFDILGQDNEHYLQIKNLLEEAQKKHPEKKIYVVSSNKQKSRLLVTRIQTFEPELLRGKALELLSDEVRTTLDVELLNAENLFNEYRSAYFEDVTQQAGGEYGFMIDKFVEKQKTFFDAINKLFADTNKSVSFNKTKFDVQTADGLLKIQKLSSGEKQLLILFTAALAQNEKPSVLLLDEPELSLNTEWQEILIEILQEINPNAQLIIVTHSPSIIANGWFDKVTEISDIIKK